MLHSLLLSLALLGDAHVAHHAVHPAESTLYVELPDLEALTAAYEGAPVVQWLRDPEWNGFAAKALDEDPETFALDAWCCASLADLLDEVAQLAGDDVDLRTAFAGLRSASLSVQLPDDPRTIAQASSAVLVFDYATPEDATAGARFCEGALQLIAEPVQHKQAPLNLFGQEGLVQEYRHTREGDLPPVWSATCGRSVVFGVGTMTQERWRSLADDATRQVTPHRDPRGDATSSGAATPLYRLQFAADDAASALDALREQYATPDLTALLDLVAGALPSGAVSIARHSTLTDGHFESVTVAGGARCVPGVGLTAVPTEAAGLLPPDALAAWVTSVDAARLEPLALDVIAAMLETDTDGARNFLADEAQLDLSADLLAGFGSAAAAYVMPLAGPAVPEHAAVVTIADRDRLVSGLQTLFDALEQRIGDGMEFRDGKYRGSATFSFRAHESLRAFGLPDLGDANMILDTIRPGLSVAVLDDRVVISSDRRNVTREVKRVAKLEEGAALHPLGAAERPYPATATCASWIEWGGALANVYDTATSLLSMVGGVLPFDAETLPPSTALQRHFGPTIAWSEPLGTEGASRMQVARGSFGPEALLALSAGLAALSTDAATPASTLPVAAPAADLDGGSTRPTPEAHRTIAVGEAYVSAIEGYRVDNGRYPLSVSVAWGAELESDGWGRAFHYRVAEDGQSYRLWSLGPNGIDESGDGDDVSYP